MPRIASHGQVNIRLPLYVVDWLNDQSELTHLPPTTYARKVLEDAAKRDVLKGHENGDLSPVADA